MKRLHLGCGLITPEGWINLDSSWNAYLSKFPIIRRLLKTLRILPKSQFDIPWTSNILIHDVRKPLPFRNNSLSVIYTSHLLEHLYLEQAKSLLKECLRKLEPQGILRVVIPDLRTIVLEYMGERPFASSPELEALSPADRLNRRLSLRNPDPLSGNALYKLYAMSKDFHSHKWMYDANSMSAYFKWAGFQNVQEMQFHQSRIEGIEKIEQASRVLHGEGICIEGIKMG